MPEANTVVTAREERRKAIIAAYLSGLSMQQVGDQFGLTRQAVWFHLRQAGVPRRGRGGNTHGGSRHRQ